MTAPWPLTEVVPAGAPAPAPSCAAPTALDLALCRSALYEALALGFRPPAADTVARLATPAGAAGLAAAAELLDRDAGPPALAPRVRRLAATDTRALAATYQDLFGHVVRGAAPAYETEYGADDLFRQPQELADLGGFYAAFGLALAAHAAERADHVACECEFLMFLARKEAAALERADAATAREAARAARLFLRDHVGRFVPSLCERIRRAGAGGFYDALADLAEAFVARDCARLGVEAGAPSLQLRSAVEDRVPMACGTCPLGPADAEPE
jgi:DMSO reductase family type II enzyme chaperone